MLGNVWTGGALLFKAADRSLGLLAALTATVPDVRAPARVTHGVGDLVAQRVFAIACGHPDGNDADRLADDPITLEDLASEFDVSRERVRQIEVRAFEKVQKAAKNRIAAIESQAALAALPKA